MARSGSAPLSSSVLTLSRRSFAGPTTCLLCSALLCSAFSLPLCCSVLAHPVSLGLLPLQFSSTAPLPCFRYQPLVFNSFPFPSALFLFTFASRHAAAAPPAHSLPLAAISLIFCGCVALSSFIYGELTDRPKLGEFRPHPPTPSRAHIGARAGVGGLSPHLRCRGRLRQIAFQLWLFSQACFCHSSIHLFHVYLHQLSHSIASIFSNCFV